MASDGSVIAKHRVLDYWPPGPYRLEESMEMRAEIIPVGAPIYRVAGNGLATGSGVVLGVPLFDIFLAQLARKASGVIARCVIHALLRRIADFRPTGVENALGSHEAGQLRSFSSE